MFEFVIQGLICTKKNASQLYLYSTVWSFHRMWLYWLVLTFIFKTTLSFCTYKRPENVSTSEIKCCNFVSYDIIKCPDTVWSGSTSAWSTVFKLKKHWQCWFILSCCSRFPDKLRPPLLALIQTKTGNSSVVEVFSVVTVCDNLSSSSLSNKLQHHNNLPDMNVNSESFVYTLVCNLSCLLHCNYHTKSHSDWHVSRTVKNVNVYIGDECVTRIKNKYIINEPDFSPLICSSVLYILNGKG